VYRSCRVPNAGPDLAPTSEPTRDGIPCIPWRQQQSAKHSSRSAKTLNPMTHQQPAMMMATARRASRNRSSARRKQIRPLSAAQQTTGDVLLISIRPLNVGPTLTTYQAGRDGFRPLPHRRDNDPSKRKANVCGDCHRMPASGQHNTPARRTLDLARAYDRF